MVKKFDNKIWIYFGIIFLLAIASYYSITQLSVISTNDYNDVRQYDITCSIDSDCEDYFRSLGATEENLQYVDLRCENNLCVGYGK